MNWGHKITITFILFAILIITMVTISVRQEIHLVAPDYYEEELAYQDQIDRMHHYNALPNKPSLVKDNGRLILTFPDSLNITQGEILFFRPSHSGMDQKFLLRLDEHNQQTFVQSDFQKGLWKTKLSWQDQNQDYFVEQTIIL
ncbi:hypothetical protein BFP72_08395 [Reichenbachiella sp. 5M10]|uniref:FixH family protein n=1 Tax=Reichenbachiella sp. 5M10 TaxID=1889772 RepID=UPI000C15B3E8|nr:FixH family protein [Reichenbachiella sp. 5M10]PIB35413.1 hypothetical protein BFP72_08395 [Reichenbachiella sp. 5M10]